MKNYLIVLFLLFPNIGFTQIIQFDISGSVVTQGSHRYAYLVHTGVDKFLIKETIKENKFYLKGSLDKKNALYRTALLFLDKRDNITLEEVKSKIDQQVWLPGRDLHLLPIVLEDIVLTINSGENSKAAKIIEGGILTSQLQELSIATKNGKRLEFVQKHPDSPISLSQISSILKYFKLNIAEGPETVFGSPLAMYNLLSDRLKKTEQGIQLKKDIDEIIKP